MGITTFSSIIESNGKTVRENNFDKEHKIPLRTLVEVEIKETYGENAWIKGIARLYVVTHGRDCDGTPLYGLAADLVAWDAPWINDLVRRAISKYYGGYDEKSLKVIRG
jgi:hypothetical protein